VYSANVKEASTILNDIRQDALDVNSHAASLQLYTAEGQADWNLHAGKLTDIRLGIDDIGIKLIRLEAILGAAMPWQRQAYQRALSLARVMAANTSSATSFASAAQDYRYSEEYKAYETNLRDESRQLGDLLHEYETAAAATEKTGTQLAKALGVR